MVGPLPDREDFDAFGYNLDAKWAWKDFGGLSRTEAFTKFCSSPDYYQEDFMFMGSAAFAFYFPVVERYIFQASVQDDEDVEAMWILAHCILQQLDPANVPDVVPLHARIRTLTQHVRSNLSKFCTTPSEQARVDEAWRELAEYLASCE